MAPVHGRVLFPKVLLATRQPPLSQPSPRSFLAGRGKYPRQRNSNGWWQRQCPTAPTPDPTRAVKTLLKCPHSHSGENVPIWFNQLFFQAVAAVGEPERSEGLPEAATA